MQERNHSDFLPWILAAAALLIMAAAVRLGAAEPGETQQRQSQAPEHRQGSAPAAV